MIYGNTLGKMTNKLTDSQNSCLLESYYWLYTAHYVCVTSWSFSCSTSIMSPGSVLGDWSASPLNVIFCPCFIPLSTCTSKTFTSLLTLRPSHSLQRSFSWITSPKNATKHWNVVLSDHHNLSSLNENEFSPSPLQSVHTDCICCTMPGASCLIMIRMPRPRHVAHFCTAPVLPPWLRKKVKFMYSFLKFLETVLNCYNPLK